MSDITSHPAYQATRRCLARVSDAVLFAAVTYEMDMGTGYADPKCPVCLVGTMLRHTAPVEHDEGGDFSDATALFGGDYFDWMTVFYGVMDDDGRAPFIEAAVADELLSRV